MNILLTGVAGSIGSFLLDSLLERGHTVVGIDNLIYGRMDNISHNLSNDNFTFIDGDITEYDFFSMEQKFDCICHLAALKKIGNMSNWKRTDLIRNNFAIQRLLRLAVEQDCKFVFSSTSDVYGTSEDLPFREDGDLKIGPSDVERWDYAASKLFDEHVCFSYADDYDIDLVVIRYFGAYSDRSKWQYGEHIPLFIKRAMEGEEITVHGDGLHTRSMCHIDDAIIGTIQSIELESANGHIINIGSNEEMTILEHAKTIWRIVNGNEEPNIKFIPMKEVFGKYREIQRRVPDLTKAKKLLDYEPKILFEDGIADVVAKIRRKND
jgi:UDP-glucose 4-epimerase